MQSRSTSEVVLGIDLGATKSVMAVFEDGDAKVLLNDIDSRLTPSCVHVSADTDSATEERLVGQAALSWSVSHPQATIRNVKSILGRAFSDVGSVRPLGAVKVCSSDSGQGAVIHLGSGTVLTPEEVASMLLVDLKKAAETQLDRGDISKAVIAVPAYFNAAQRQAVKDAAFLAGLQVQDLVNETSAAAAVYAEDREDKTFLIVDIGGGGTSIAVARSGKSLVQVLATSAKRLPGGEDFDIRMVDYFTESIKQRDGVEVAGARSLEILRSEWERAKRKLSRLPVTKLALFLPDERVEVQREVQDVEFEEQCGPMFQTIVDELQPTLDRAAVVAAELDDVVLVGASSRVPWLRTAIEAALARPLCKALNPDEAVAQGAAMLAARCVSLAEVTASATRIISAGKEIHVEANATLPLQSMFPEKLGPSVMVRQGYGKEFVTIFETKRNAEISFHGFRVNASGCFDVLDRSGAPVPTVLRGCLSGEARQALLGKAETRLEEDAAELRRIEAKNSLDDKCRTILKQEPEAPTDSPDADSIQELRGDCAEHLQWMKTHPNATLGEWKTRLDQVECKWLGLKDRRELREKKGRREGEEEREREGKRKREGREGEGMNEAVDEGREAKKKVESMASSEREPEREWMEQGRISDQWEATETRTPYSKRSRRSKECHCTML